MRCDNLNHLRPSPPIRHCPQCGGAVNERRPRPTCEPAAHAARRRAQANYCVDCGAELIAPPPAVR